MASRDHDHAVIGATPESAAPDLFGASGKNHGGVDEPWAMPAPTTVSPAKDGHPSGRHMIDGYRMMGAAARVSGGKHQAKMAEVYEMAALCIENEAARADRAEAMLAVLGSNSVGSGEAVAAQVPGESSRDTQKDGASHV